MSPAMGQLAEDAAADFLTVNGYTVLDRNWKTRRCEIDIVAEKDHVFYFIEVKYRGSDKWGTGFDYITSAKLRQMHFSAECWMASRADMTTDYRLSAIELTGQPPHVTRWVESVI